MNTALINVNKMLSSRLLTYLEDDNTEEALTRFYLPYARNVNIENVNNDAVNDSDNAKYLWQCHTFLKQVLERFNIIFSNKYINSLHKRHCYNRT